MHTQLPAKRRSMIGCDPASVDKIHPKLIAGKATKKGLCCLRRLTLADSLAHVHLGHFYGVQLLPELSYLCLYVQCVLILPLTRHNCLTSHGGLN